ncbi:Fc receptor-like protein [Sarotherodon galilaeus]
MRRLHSGKSAGPDRLSPHAFAPQLCEVFHKLFMLSLSLQRILVLWKKSCLLPVPKSQRPRPVALTSQFMETLQKLILNQLQPMFKSHLEPLHSSLTSAASELRTPSSTCSIIICGSEFSRLDVMMGHSLLCVMGFFLFTTVNYGYAEDVHSAASLTVSPDRVQHFTFDSVSLTCEGNFTEWRVVTVPQGDPSYYYKCERMTGSTCNFKTSKSGTGVYWCESGSGEFSSAVNITVQNYFNYKIYGPILVSPVHPVTEGASVSLSCSLKTQKILSNVFFYYNDKLIQNDTRGELNISAVSKSDEGFYKCQYSGRESAQSWMSVKVTVSGADSSSSPVWLMVGLVCGASLIIILLLLLYCCRQSKYSCFTRSIQSESHSPVSSTNHGVNQNETHEYGSLQHGTANFYESIEQVKNRNGDYHEPEGNAYYINVQM